MKLWSWLNRVSVQKMGRFFPRWPQLNIGLEIGELSIRVAVFEVSTGALVKCQTIVSAEQTLKIFISSLRQSYRFHRFVVVASICCHHIMTRVTSVPVSLSSPEVKRFLGGKLAHLQRFATTDFVFVCQPLSSLQQEQVRYFLAACESDKITAVQGVLAQSGLKAKQIDIDILACVRSLFYTEAFNSQRLDRWFVGHLADQQLMTVAGTGADIEFIKHYPYSVNASNDHTIDLVWAVFEPLLNSVNPSPHSVFLSLPQFMVAAVKDRIKPLAVTAKFQFIILPMAQGPNNLSTGNEYLISLGLALKGLKPRQAKHHCLQLSEVVDGD